MLQLNKTMKKIIINSSQAKLLKSLNEDINSTFSSAFKKEPSKSFKPNMNDNKGKKFNPLAENETEKNGKFGKNMIDLLKKIIKDGSEFEFELPKFFENYNIDKDILLNLLKSNHIINDKLQVYKNNLVDNVRNLYNDLNTNHIKKNETDLAQTVTEDNNDPSIDGEKTHSTTPTNPKYKPLNVIHFNREICILKDDKDKLFVYYYFDVNKDDFKPYASIDYKYIGKDFDGEPEYEFDENWEVDKDVLTRYVNDNLGELTKGKGLKSYENGKDLCLIDDVLKTELIGLYDKDKKLVDILGGISEDTTAASSGSFSTPLSGDNVIKKDIVSEFEDEGPQPGDSEYHNEYSREREVSGLSKFEDIDWMLIHEVLMNNTKKLKLKQPINDIDYSINNFAEIGLSKEDIWVLNHYDIIEIINKSTPILYDEKYYNFNYFKQEVEKIWNKTYGKTFELKEDNNSIEKPIEIGQLVEHNTSKALMKIIKITPKIVLMKIIAVGGLKGVKVGNLQQTGSNKFWTRFTKVNDLGKVVSIDEDNGNNNREKIYINGFEWWLDKIQTPPKVYHTSTSKEEGISIYSNHFTGDERKQVLDFIKYGRKGESSKFIDETTDSSSSGQYSQPAFLAKDPNNSRFSKKPMYPNGTIVNKKIKVSENFIYNQISKKLNKSVNEVKKIVYEQKIPLNKLPKLLKLVENGNELKTQTTYKDGEMVGFDNCTKLNNNKEAQKGKCSVGAIDKVAKGTKTKDSLMENREILKLISLLEPHKQELQKTVDNAFQQGLPTTTFMRELNHDIQILANIDIPTSDDFYSKSKNIFMKQVLNWLGYSFDEFGIHKFKNESLNEDNDKVKTSLKNQILTAFPNMNDEDFDKHETDLYVRYSPEVDNWLKQNYEFYKNITTFKSNVDNQRWFDIPFAAWDEKYGKKSSDIGIEGEKNPNLTPQQKEHLKRINEMPLQAIINALNKMKVDPETISPQFIESNWWGKLTYDWENKRWLSVSDSEAQGGLALNAVDRSENLSENNLNINKIFDITNIKENVEKIKSNIKAPYIGVQYSTLGGDANVSILIVVSLDPKETWSNGYIENTRYFRLHLDNDGTLEMFTVSKLPLKLRKSKNKSIDEVINRINKYINTINSQNNSNLSK